MQRCLEYLAKTDMKAAMDYEQSVREFHTELRNWHYPRLFKDQPFEADSAKIELSKFIGETYEERAND